MEKLGVGMCVIGSEVEILRCSDEEMSRNVKHVWFKVFLLLG